MRTGIKLDGVSELKSTLDRAFNELGRKETEKLLVSAGRVVRDEMKALAPVKTGKLRASIKITRNPRNRKSSIASIFVGPTRPDGSYAHLVEYGSRGQRKIKGLKLVRIRGQWVRITTTGVMPKKPFIAPAWEKTREPFTQKLTELVEKKLRAIK